MARPDDFSNPYDPNTGTGGPGDVPPPGEPPAEPTPPTAGEPPPNNPPEPPRMLSAALFGSPTGTDPISIAKAGGSDADFAAFFDRAAAQLRGGL